MKTLATTQRRLYPHQIDSKLKAVARHQATGASLKSACEAQGISVASFYRWRSQRGGATPAGKRPPPASPGVRERVLKAAATAFLRDGWEASIAHVAVSAGVSRQTVYNLYGSRDNLFGQVVGAQYAARLRSVKELPPDMALPEALKKCAEEQLAITLDPEAVAMLRITQTEFRKNPRLASIAYAMRTSRDSQNITGLIADRLAAEVARGGIEKTDTRRAAEIFIAAVTGPARHRVINGLPQYSDTYLEESIDLVVQLFLRGLRYTPADGAQLLSDIGESGC